VKLRRNEYCPIHRSVRCCGHEQTHYARRLQPEVRRIDDPHHPRGYRELRSPAEMRKLLKRKVAEQNRICAICREAFTDYNDVVPYADFGIRDRMPTFRICRSTPCTGLKQVVRDRTMSAYSECLKKRKEGIRWPVTAGTGIYGGGPRECLFFESEVRMKVDLRSFHLLMTEPEGDDREVDPGM
jgi:hypothetical protein